MCIWGTVCFLLLKRNIKALFDISTEKWLHLPIALFIPCPFLVCTMWSQGFLHTNDSLTVIKSPWLLWAPLRGRRGASQKGESTTLWPMPPPPAVSLGTRSAEYIPPSFPGPWGYVWVEEEDGGSSARCTSWSHMFSLSESAPPPKAFLWLKEKRENQAFHLAPNPRNRAGYVVMKVICNVPEGSGSKSREWTRV